MNRLTHVVLFTRSFEIGGAEVQMSALARGLPQNEFKVTVICLYERGPLIEEIRSAGIRIICLEKRGRWDLVGFFPRMLKTIRNLEPDILQAFLAPPNILSSLAKPFLNSCTVILGIRSSNMDLAQYDWTWRVTHFVERKLARLANGLVANSVSGQEHSIALGFPNSITVIPNGFDIDKFRPKNKNGNAIRTEWNIPADAPLIGLIGRLDPMKDHQTFIRAAAEVHKTNPEYHFVCVGDGPEIYASTLASMTKEVGLDTVFHWAGARQDMPDVYSALDLTTLTSYGEGFPNTIGEAMACGKRCVVTDVGDCANLVGSTGIVRPARDVKGIAAAWIEMLECTDNEREQGEIECRARIVEHYSISTMVDSYSELYRHHAKVAGIPQIG
jgi:glycosyltransferase involved in cell wall biosynthesis